jgi:proline racemase
MLQLDASFDVIDSHTAGHPTRVILSGIPPLAGGSVREQRDDFRARLDRLRPQLLHEPRGHAAMVGLVPVPSAVADYGAFFVSSYVYLDMCGHATIGYARTLAATGQIAPATGDAFTLETPAGVVRVGLAWAPDGGLAAVRLRNVPSHVGIAGLEVPFEGFGTVRMDIVYSGMWYALVEAETLGLTLAPGHVTQLLAVGSALKKAVAAALEGHPAIGGAPMPSVLFHADDGRGGTVQLLVLESNKFDRSPCGTGTAARLTQLAAQGRLPADGVYRARNIFGVTFLATVAEATAEAVTVEVEGIAHLTARSCIMVERGDPLAAGFLCR